MYFVWWPSAAQNPQMDNDESGLLFFLGVLVFLFICLWINYYKIKYRREKRERCMRIEGK